MNSNAISGVSRSETTWTFTRADGTTFTVTQQDNNTTYAAATTAAAGLMSTSDKSTLTSLNNKLTVSSSTTASVPSYVTKQNLTIYKYGRILIVNIAFDATTDIMNGSQIMSGIPSAFRPNTSYSGIVESNTHVSRYINFRTGGDIVASGPGVPKGTWYVGQIIAISAS